ncbi:uncharacterized protein LOC131316926 isoform X1 [Rhododendron vialii]|uniref:uncharacterized protein LOC131316926 isoform X1 n=1 Tax=Rhododendron vialii TaxID=182163 RepID=UPI00265FF5F7|nr:uncharacterized protein LOC131316926 isoform X1 [Rhododendron vialii]
MNTQMYPKAMRSPVPLIILFILISFGAGGTQGQTRSIPGDEMAALRDIAQQLAKTDWDLSLKECDENGNWHTPVKHDLYNSTVNCICLGDGCHISAMYGFLLISMFFKIHIRILLTDTIESFIDQLCGPKFRRHTRGTIFAFISESH